MARSRNLVFESWIPLKYRKRKGTNWIQLWHGTPIKKMLFDSNEPFFSVSNPKHKLNKYKDIRRWDYLICENYSNKNYFKEAFLIDNKKILAYGYPRVKYLLDNINNISKKLEIKKLLNIPRNKKIIFYAPTWRDYNYGNKKPCFKYLLNLQELKNNISSDYVIVLKNHAFLDSGLLLEGIINISHEVETQDLLLISDILISDYSSIIFDYIAIDKPIILYANDIERYQECRGLYPAVWKELDFAVCTEFNQVIDIINMVDNNKYPYDKISYIKKNYCCQNIDYCYQNIYKLLK
jgi:CDP-glycerol glycerophosphotransferase